MILIFKFQKLPEKKFFQLINKEIPYTVKIESSLRKSKKIYMVDKRIFVRKILHKSTIIERWEKIKENCIRARSDIGKI